MAMAAELLFFSSSSPLPLTHQLQGRVGRRGVGRLHLITDSSSSSSSYQSNTSTETTTTRQRRRRRRPLRPSFQEQALRRWSTRPPSQTLTFPWHQQQQHDDDDDDDEVQDWPTQFRLQINDTTDGSSSRLGESMAAAAFNLSNQNTLSQSVSAPWAHGPESGNVYRGSDHGIETQVDNGVRHHEFGVEEKPSDKIDKKATNSVQDRPGSDVDAGTPSQRRGGGFSGTDSKSSVSVTDVVDRFRKSMGRNGGGRSLTKLNGNAADDLSAVMGSVIFPWEREEDSCDGNNVSRKKSNTELAERTVPEPELRRLRDAALRMKERMKVGAAGVTEAVVEGIREKWKQDEVVKMRFEGPPSLNMKRTHDILENKTGGIVIWRSGRSLVLYRGMNYELPCIQSYAKLASSADSDKLINDASNVPATGAVRGHRGNSLHASKAADVHCSTSLMKSSQEITHTSDIDSLLDKLGPRYKDWSGRSPIPVDADMLPCVVPGYKPPFRLLPYKTRSTLRDSEMTSLRRLARQMAPHFALGRNRQHQGLATAIVKLWEKSAIAKIAIKRGIPNTCNERMAEEIKKLTGGVLLSRNKEYIVLYRGNDFVTPSIRDVLVEKEQQAIIQQDEEEVARLRASASITANSKVSKRPLVAGTLAETTEAQSRWGNPLDGEEREKAKKDIGLAKQAALVRHLERKLFYAKSKVAKAEKALAKVQEFLDPAELPTDLETVTDEERFLFRKIGLTMRAFLLLGRRGVFDGTVQNMHFHWKHRELVKIIVKGKSFAQVKHIAISLEAESGGVLISLDKTTKGYAIIFYRGKNYKRPQILKPRNLLTRRQALARSIELQRREALNQHISNLQDRIQMLKSQLDQMKDTKEMQDRDLFVKVNDALLSDDDIVDEGEEAYLETYSCGDEDDSNASNEYF